MFFCQNSVYSKQLTAKSAIVVDSASGKICFGKNIYSKRLPASTTKLVTALVARDNALLSDKFVVSKNAAKIEPSKAYLTFNEKYLVSSLLSAALMSSANDASIVLAEGIAGDEKKFVDLMNAKCKEIGAKNTKFANCTGLPSKEKQYTTVYDLVVIMNKVMKDPVLVNIMEKKQKEIKGTDGKEIKLINHNKYLWKTDGLLLGKTGYTIAAGQCFAGFKKNKFKNDILFAVLGGKTLWGDIKEIISGFDS